MKFMTPMTGFYCGVDLHARSLYICVVDRPGKILMHRKIGTDPEYFLRLIQPWGKDITVAVESTFNWYWLADVCASEDIPFALAHALYLNWSRYGKFIPLRFRSPGPPSLTRRAEQPGS